MVALEMPQSVFGIFPPTLINIRGTETTVEPLPIVRAKEDSVYLTGGAVIVLARFVPSHIADQGIGRYTVFEYGFQEADCRWVTSVGDAVCSDQRQICRIVGCRASLLAEARPSVRVCSYSSASHWMVHCPRSRMGIC